MKKLLLLLIIPFLCFGQSNSTEMCCGPYSCCPFNAEDCYFVNQPCQSYHPTTGILGYWFDYIMNSNCDCGDYDITPISGCNNPDACNYNWLANVDDGSCIVITNSECQECSWGSLLVINDFDNDGVCEYEDNCPGTFNMSQLDSDNDGVGDACEVLGCDDEDACNYDEDATENDGSCIFSVNQSICNYDCDDLSLTFVPDNSFENYIETTFPNASNGIPNDNYVLTFGLNFNDPNNYQSYPPSIYINENVLDYPIFDFTGIESFKNIKSISLSGPSILANNIDLSCVTFDAEDDFSNDGLVNINNCLFLETIVLPSDTISVEIFGNSALSEIYFQPGAHYKKGAYYSMYSIYIGGSAFLGLAPAQDNLCSLNILGNALPNFMLSFYGEGNTSSINLSEFNSTYNSSAVFVFNSLNDIYDSSDCSNWQIKFNNNIYDWTSVSISDYLYYYCDNLFNCVEVFDKSYSQAYWTDNGNVSYSNNCWDSNWTSCNSSVFIDEKDPDLRTLIYKTDFVGKVTNTTKGFQLEIYDDGSVEKKYVIK